MVRDARNGLVSQAAVQRRRSEGESFRDVDSVEISGDLLIAVVDGKEDKRWNVDVVQGTRATRLFWPG